MERLVSVELTMEQLELVAEVMKDWVELTEDGLENLDPEDVGGILVQVDEVQDMVKKFEWAKDVEDGGNHKWFVQVLTHCEAVFPGLTSGELWQEFKGELLHQGEWEEYKQPTLGETIMFIMEDYEYYKEAVEKEIQAGTIIEE